MHVEKRRGGFERNMDVSLVPALNSRETLVEGHGTIAGRPLQEWNAAYEKVESYFRAMRLRNRVLLGRVVLDVLNRAMLRAPVEPGRTTTELAAEEMDLVLNEWFAHVLEESSLPDHMLSTRGRLALLLADMPGKWQDQFLQPGPWPENLVFAMRDAYLRAGPDFQLSQMTPRPLELGPVAKLTNLPKLRYKTMVLIWILGALALSALFVITHSALR
jgi:hypothetical protein